MDTQLRPDKLDEVLARLNAEIELKKRFNSKRELIRTTISDWINYIRLYFEIKQNPYFTIFGLDKVNNIDDAVLKGISVKNTRYISEQEYNIDKYKQRVAFYKDLQEYKKYDDRFKGQPDKNFNERFAEYNPSHGNTQIRLFAFKVVSVEWLDVINNLLSEYKNSPPPPGKQLDVKVIQSIITSILASPIETKNANVTTNNMLNEIDLEFSKKLSGMNLSDPESELGSRRADEHQHVMVRSFLQGNQQATSARNFYSHRIRRGRGMGMGGRQYKRPRKSSATKRRPRRKSTAIKRRRRRTSRK
jgi:hypothetical protein